MLWQTIRLNHYDEEPLSDFLECFGKKRYLVRKKRYLVRKKDRNSLDLALAEQENLPNHIKCPSSASYEL
jgi:hypothetical protein